MLPQPGQLAPLYVRPMFTSKSIGQTSPLYNRQNVLHVTIAFNSRVEVGSIIIISGLVGASAPSGKMALGGRNSTLFVSNASFLGAEGHKGNGTWDNTSKSLLLTVFSDIAACHAVCQDNITIHFQVDNPPLGQEAPLSHIEVTGPTRIQITPMDRPHDVVRRAMYVQTMFVRKDIGQSTSFPGAINTITATIAGNVQHLKRQSASISISGLSGPALQNDELITLRACVCPLPLAEYSNDAWTCQCLPTIEIAQTLFKPRNCDEGDAGKGVWNSSTQGLQAFLRTDTSATNALLLEFDVVNPISPQLPSSVYISGRGPLYIQTMMSSSSEESKPITVRENR